ncbi:MAG: putative N-acetylmannosamine-6-phosphate 2-epimerase [Gordonia sp. (in: high G+C Gram-positive bacteria)]
MTILDRLRGGLIVSCQARADNALRGPIHMAAMALAAQRGGAVGIRAEGAADIEAIRAVVDVPIIGIRKILDGRPVYITPDFASARDAAAAGADAIALDATLRDRPAGDQPAELISRIHDELGIPVMADIDSVTAGLAAAAAGADLIATTLSGYTTGAEPPQAPDIALVSELCAATDTPIVAEGRIRTAEDVAAAFGAGAWSVVVGTAITNPERITARLAAHSPRGAR